MIYLIRNHYTQKLFNQIRNRHPELKMISLDEYSCVESSDTLVIDESDFIALKSLVSELQNVVLLGDCGAIKFEGKRISKYQSYRQIQCLLFESSHPIYFLTHHQTTLLSNEMLDSIRKQFDVDYVISLNYEPESDFSLYHCLVNESSLSNDRKPLEVITSLKDYLNPPIDELVNLVHKTREKGSILIYSAPLKGDLDYALMELSDKVILFGPNWPKCMVSELSNTVASDKIQILDHAYVR